MSVATASPPAVNGRQQIEGRKPLWGDIDIPIIVATGEYASGKTLLGLTICPGPETLVYDNEGSSLTYRSLGFTHVDMAEELAKKHNGQRYSAQDRYIWWRDDILERAKSGKYRVGVIDPASEIEDGIAEYIKTHVSEFDLTAEQVRKSLGLFWGAMKKEWKFTLERLRPYFETLYLTVHLRDQFVGNAPSGKREPKGKDTLMELASLALWMERTPDKDGVVPAQPAAHVLKSRLARPHFDPETGEVDVVPILPPRLPIATPAAIRKYIASPPNYKRLKEGERFHEKVMSEDEKLRLQAQIAADHRAASEAEVSRIDKMQAAAAAQAAASAAAPQSPDQSASLLQQPAEKAAARVAKRVSQSQVDRIVKLLPQAFGNNDLLLGEFMDEKLSLAGVAKIPELEESEADGIESDLLAIVAKNKQAALADKRAEIEKAPDANNSRTSASEPPFEVPPVAEPAHKPPATERVPITQQQIDGIVAMIPKAFPTDQAVEAGFPPLLAAYGVERISQLNSIQAGELYGKLQFIESRLHRAGGSDLTAPGSITDDQMRRLQSLAERTNWGPDAREKWLKDRSCSTFKNLSYEQADDRIEELLKIELGFSGGTPGNA
jgi:hypothetical protein